MSMTISIETTLEEVMLSRDDLAVLRGEVDETIKLLDSALPSNSFGDGIVSTYARAMGVDRSKAIKAAISKLETLRRKVDDLLA